MGAMNDMCLEGLSHEAAFCHNDEDIIDTHDYSPLGFKFSLNAEMVCSRLLDKSRWIETGKKRKIKKMDRNRTIRNVSRLLGINIHVTTLFCFWTSCAWTNIIFGLDCTASRYSFSVVDIATENYPLFCII